MPSVHSPPNRLLPTDTTACFLKSRARVSTEPGMMQNMDSSILSAVTRTTAVTRSSS